jgi:hypothetical protein
MQTVSNKEPSCLLGVAWLFVWRKGSQKMRRVFIAIGLVLVFLVGTNIQIQAQEIHGCFSNREGKLRIVSGSEECNTKKETYLYWNQTGPQGPQGEPGEPGEPGPPGQDCPITIEEFNDLEDRVAQLEAEPQKGTWEGNYTISTLADLEAFRGYSSITGNLFFDQSYLTNLDGLSSLTSIGGNLEIYDNDALTNLDGLSNLTSIGGKLHIDDNDALITLNMDSLNFVFANFQISRNIELCSYLAEDLRDQVMAGGGIGGSIEIADNKNCP